MPNYFRWSSLTFLSFIYALDEVICDFLEILMLYIFFDILQMSSLKTLPTLAPLERVSLLLMSQQAPLASVYPASMLRMLSQTGVLSASSFSALPVPFSTSVVSSSSRRPSTRRLLLVWC